MEHTDKQKNPDAIRAHNVKYYGVACIYHPNGPCSCAERKAKRRDAEDQKER